MTLLPARYVKPYRQRNKTDRADCEAVLEALRSPRIKPVAVKSEEQQAILALHRAREQWKETRTMRINGIRGMLRELKGIARAHPVMRTLLEIPGIGAITATALYASIGNIHLFENGRQVASWLGLTPKENSSGSRRRLGRMSKRGNSYLRTLLIHGARSALTAAQGRQKKGMPLTRLEQWALEKSTSLRHSNQAAVGLANKMARIVWAIWAHERRFDGNHVPLPKAA